MPTIQISQIILRSGPSIDLPGAPTSLSPLAFGPGLKPGEMAFMTDTGRIYIGHDPAEGQPSYNRLTYPYRNIEVLTENSTDALQRIVGETSKEEGEFAYHTASLGTHGTDWEDVVLPRAGDPTYVYRLPFADGMCATIDYAAYDPSMRPVKTGTMTVRHFTGEAEPSLVDEASVARRTDLFEPEVHQAQSVYNQVEFRFVVAGPIGARYLAFQYKNRTGTVLSLRFKTSRPKV
jgi:hypothetical protein